ncbi:MAG TPA: Abi-alpha family protein [Mycobacterium sp.]|nr:Abi-alpha family protein [Mycobacterium sp.]
MGRKRDKKHDKQGAGSPIDGLGSLVGLGTPAAQLLNAASDLVAALDHARSAGGDFWNAISYLDKLNRGSGTAAGGVLNPLGVVGKIAGGATGLDQTTGSSNDAKGAGAGLGRANPLTAVTDVLSGVLGGTRPSAPGSPAPDVAAAGPFPTPLVQNLAASLGLPGNEVINAVGTAANTVTKPVADQVGEGLKLAQNLTGAPLQGVGELVGKVLGAEASAETAAALRERGSRLVRISYKPEYQRRDLHPSFSRIIDELLPDEARILRFLGVAGTQPMIDVRTKTLFQVGSVLLVGGISMIAQMAGCHWPDRDQHYFANLHRLGLLNLSREPVDDYRRYALLEVQPAAVTAIESVPKAVTVYRSVRLTAFGSQFVDVCIDTEGYNAGGWDTDGRQDKIKGKGPPEKRADKHA